MLRMGSTAWKVALAASPGDLPLWIDEWELKIGETVRCGRGIKPREGLSEQQDR
jgi:hypothetical protein